ncbi:MAG: fibronectin type III domain-containing protein [Chitinophagales bacterium]
MRKRLLLLSLVFFVVLTLSMIPGSEARAEYTSEYNSSIVIEAPTTGATLFSGSTYEIKWSYEAILGTNIFYSPNGGTTWYRQNDDMLPSGTSSYTWTVPTATTNQGRIRVEVSTLGLGGGFPPMPTTYYYYNDTGDFKITNVSLITPIFPVFPIEFKPVAPSNLTATAVSNSEINLAWTDKSNNETGFYIHRKLEGDSGYTTVGHVGAGVVTFNNPGLDPGTTYYYVVTAYNDQGSSAFSNEASANTGVLLGVKPAAPSGLVATAVSGTSIQLSWQDNANNETGFYIFRKTQGSPISKIDTISADWNGYTDTGLIPGTRYIYVVAAYNSNGTSSYSNEASATTIANLTVTVPAVPLQLTANALSGTEINLTWLDNCPTATGFKIERKVEGGSFSEIAKPAAHVTVYKDTGLVPLTKYIYRIRAYNSAGNSGYSNEASDRTLQGSSQPQNPATGTTILRFFLNNTKYYINDKVSSMDAAPISKYSRTLLPVRYVATPLGADVSWEPINQKVTVKLGNIVLELWVNKNTARVNGIEKRIDPDNSSVVPITVPPGRTMLPLRFIAENLGCDVDWDQIAQEAKVTYPKTK